MQNYWWDKDNKNVHEDLYAVMKHLDQTQSKRSDDDLIHLRLYGNFDSLGMTYNNYATSTSSRLVSNKLSLNIVQNMCDTVTNKIAKNKPRVQFLTNGGTGKDQKKSKLLTKFVDGCVLL